MKIKPEVIGFIGLAAIVGMAIGKGMRNSDKNEDTDTGGTDDGTTSDYCGYDQSKLAGRTWDLPEEGYLSYTRMPRSRIFRGAVYGSDCKGSRPKGTCYQTSGCQTLVSSQCQGSKKACDACGGFYGGDGIAKNRILRG